MHLIHLESVDSTNDDAKRRLERGEITRRTIITAREQIAGRGTRGRHWISPRNTGLYLTYIDPAPSCREPTTTLTMAAAVACAEALDDLGVTVGVKPVNDLVVRGRKLGGILIETVVRGGAVQALLVGVGLNLRIDDRPVDPPALAPITLAEITGAIPDVKALVSALARSLPVWLDRAGDASVQTAYEACLA